MKRGIIVWWMTWLAVSRRPSVLAEADVEAVESWSVDEVLAPRDIVDVDS